MQIVQAAEMPVKTRQSSGRVGSYGVRDVMNGEPGSAGNFSLKIYDQNGSFGSPRHHHSFDQFRYQIEGDADFGRTGKMRPGTLGYFPEGAYYGPQSGPPHVVAVLQFGGPSGLGYLSSGEHRGAAEELRKHGVFEGGIYRRNPDVEGKRNQDSYEAIWEHVNKRKLAYPKPRYDEPIRIKPQNFDWLPRDGQKGVAQKPLGMFSERRSALTMLRLDAGASTGLEPYGGIRIGFVVQGEGAVNGRAVYKHSAFSIDPGEACSLSGGTGLQLLIVELPQLENRAAQAA